MQNIWYVSPQRGAHQHLNTSITWSPTCSLSLIQRMTDRLVGNDCHCDRRTDRRLNAMSRSSASIVERGAIVYAFMQGAINHA